jgi:hypothetical protein
MSFLATHVDSGSDSDEPQEDVASQDILKYQEAAQRAEARRDEDDDDFDEGRRTNKRGRSEAPKPPSAKRSRPITRKRQQSAVSVEHESMISPATRSVGALLTQATTPLHDSSPDDLKRHDSTYSTPLMLPLSSESPEDHRGSSTAKQLNESLLKRFTNKRAMSPSKAPTAPSNNAASKRPQRQAKSKPSSAREETPLPTLHSIERPTATPQRPLLSQRLPSPRPGSSTSATTTGAVPQASDYYKLFADVGRLGPQRLDAAQVVQANRTALDQSLAEYHKIDSEYRAALNRLPENCKDIFGFSGQ